MFVHVVVDIPLHPASVSPTNTITLEYDETTTFQQLYDYLLTLSYTYPKYKLYWREREIKNRTSRLSKFLSPENNTLNLNDPPFLTGLLIGGLAAGAIGYGMGKRAGRKQQAQIDHQASQAYFRQN